jgi:hypothetical protein
MDTFKHNDTSLSNCAYGRECAKETLRIRVTNTKWADAKIMLRLPALMDLVYID